MKRFIRLTIILVIATSLIVQCKQYLILVSLDGFRWDYAHRGLTPNLEQVREKGVSAMSLRPVFPTLTFPNHYSIISGMYPENHGIISNEFFNPIAEEQYSYRQADLMSDSKWYLGEAFWETAERNGIKTATFFWPGSDVSLPYRRPTYLKKYDSKIPYKERVNQVIEWLKLPEKERPFFITLYFEEVDIKSQEYGVNSKETNQAIKLLDDLIGYLQNSLKATEISDSVNIIIVSDHGMTDIYRDNTIDINKILSGKRCKVQNYGAFAMVEAQEDLEEIYTYLKKNEYNYKVYKKSEVPEYLHFSKHPFISSLIILPENGWFITEKTESYSLTQKAAHGYDNEWSDMHGIFFAIGPAFKTGYSCGTLWNIDINPLMCKIFGISPRSNIDGKLDRIGFILKR